MTEKTGTIQYYAMKHKGFIRRRIKWTDKCREWVSNSGVKLLTYLAMMLQKKKKDHKNAVDHLIDLVFRHVKMILTKRSDCIRQKGCKKKIQHTVIQEPLMIF